MGRRTLERSLGGQKDLLLLQQFPTHTCNSSQLPETQAPGEPASSSGLCLAHIHKIKKLFLKRHGSQACWCTLLSWHSGGRGRWILWTRDQPGLHSESQDSQGYIESPAKNKKMRDSNLQRLWHKIMLNAWVLISENHFLFHRLFSYLINVQTTLHSQYHDWLARGVGGKHRLHFVVSST